MYRLMHVSELLHWRYINKNYLHITSIPGKQNSFNRKRYIEKNFGRE